MWNQQQQRNPKYFYISYVSNALKRLQGLEKLNPVTDKDLKTSNKLKIINANLRLIDNKVPEFQCIKLTFGLDPF